MSSERADVLSFSVVGHPNEGKSSVVSTLTERDDVRISQTPGETEKAADYTVSVDGVPLLRFVDTPGFQVPRKTLRWLERRGGDGTPEETVDAFVAAHGGKVAFAHDVRALRAVAETQGVLYVVDATKPLGPDDLAEMEILRRVGRTRMAILNSKGDDSRYLDAWQTALNRHFNAIRRFNAQGASFVERIRLLQALKLTEQDWESALDRVVAVLETDWERRRERAAGVICELLSDCLGHVATAGLPKGADRQAVQASLLERYANWIRKREEKAHGEICGIFRHRHFSLELARYDVASPDLFSSETWRVLGLNRRQLAVASAVAGAGVGAAVDVALGQITFGVFMAGGALLGGVSGMAGAKPLSNVQVRLGGLRGRLGQRRLEVGPPKGVQLAYVLIDRALLYVDTISHWAHARRDVVEADALTCGLPLTRDWPRDAREAVSDYAARAVKGRRLEEREQRLREQLVGRLERTVSES